MAFAAILDSPQPFFHQALKVFPYSFANQECQRVPN